MTILIDMDGPLANFEQGFLNHWQQRYPNLPFIPLEKRSTFYVHEQYPNELFPKVEGIYTSPGFFRTLPVVKGAKEAIQKLKADEHSIWICTAPIGRYDNCVLEKYMWVEKNLGSAFTKRIILTKDKTLIRGDILIDDRPEITGLYDPTWEHALFDMPFNKNINIKKRVTWQNWQTVLQA